MTTLHDYTGYCDLCGLEADSEVTEVVGLDCSFANCPENASLYHQACLEKYLKSMKCERNRKIGFPCPRGHGKATKFPDKCKGKVMKSHPVTIRSEGNKKRRQAELEGLNRTITAEKESSAGKPAKKEEKKQAAPAKEEAAAKTKPAAIKALNVANVALTKLPPKLTAKQQKEAEREKALEAQKAAAARLKAELAAKASGIALPKPKPAAAAPAKPQTKTFEEYMAERSTSSASSASRLERQSSTATSTSTAPVQVPTANVWGARARSASLSTPQYGSVESSEVASSADAWVSSNGDLRAAAQHTPHAAWGATRSAFAVQSPRSSQPDDDHATVSSGTVDTAAVDPNEPIPGMILAAKGTEGLTKAQKKNLKRAEKKAAARAETAVFETGSGISAPSAPGSLPSSVVDSGALAAASEAELYPDVYTTQMPPLADDCRLPHELPAHNTYQDKVPSQDSSAEMDVTAQCYRRIVQHKLQGVVTQLVTLGFRSDAAVTAVLRSGGDLETAVVFLMAGGAAGLAERQPSAAVDISEDLAKMQMLQARHGLAGGVVEAIVVDCDGDVAAAESLLKEQCGGAPSLPTPSQMGSQPATTSSGLFDGWDQGQGQGRTSPWTSLPDFSFTELAMSAVNGGTASLQQDPHPQQPQQQYSAYSQHPRQAGLFPDSLGIVSSPRGYDMSSPAAPHSLWDDVSGLGGQPNGQNLGANLSNVLTGPREPPMNGAFGSHLLPSAGQGGQGYGNGTQQHYMQPPGNGMMNGSNGSQLLPSSLWGEGQGGAPWSPMGQSNGNGDHFVQSAMFGNGNGMGQHHHPQSPVMGGHVGNAQYHTGQQQYGRMPEDNEINEMMAMLCR